MGVKSRLIGCEDGPFRHVRACWGWGNLLYYKGPLCLLLCLLCSQKFWPLFCEESLLQEVKPGVQCPTEDQEWHRREQRDIGGEGQCQERHGSTGRYGSCSSHLLFTLNSMCFFFFCSCSYTPSVVSGWHDVTAEFALSRQFSLQGSQESVSVFQMCVFTVFARLYVEGDVAAGQK